MERNQEQLDKMATVPNHLEKRLKMEESKASQVMANLSLSPQSPSGLTEVLTEKEKLLLRLETRLTQLGEDIDAARKAGNLELKVELKEERKEIKEQIDALRRELQPLPNLGQRKFSFRVQE